jgi:hypothetical protein
VIKWKNLTTICVLFIAGCSTATQHAPLQPPQVGITQVEITDSEDGASSSPHLILQSGNLSLSVLSPQDGAVVNSSPVEVIVVSNVETVFTINGDLFVLAAGQESAFLMSLAEGFNTIELVASNYEGDQVATILTVIYEP